jgi:hypothetical protein
VPLDVEPMICAEAIVRFHNSQLIIFYNSGKSRAKMSISTRTDAVLNQKAKILLKYC